MSFNNVSFSSDYGAYDINLSLLTLSDEWLLDIDKNFVDSIDFKLTENNSINLTIPYYTVKNGKTVKYVGYDLFDDNRTIALNESHKFIIRNTEVIEGLTEHYKKITAYSLESTLQRIPSIMEDATMQLMSDDVNITSGFLNKFKEQCYGWDFTCTDSARKENINGVISNKYRWVSCNDSNFLESIRQTITDAFHVVCVFDSYNKILHVLSEDEINNHSGLFLDFGNYLKSTSKTTNREKSCTQLRVTSDKTSISSVNINGSEIIEKYSDEIKSKMSIELKNALVEYDVISLEQNLTFLTKKVELENVEKTISDKNIELIELKEQFKVLDIKQKQYISTLDAINLAINQPLFEQAKLNVSNKELEITNLNDSKKAIESIIQGIAVKLNKETCTNGNGQNIFNHQTLSELFMFTTSDTYQNETALTPYTLLNDAKHELAKRQDGIMEFTISEFTNQFIFGIKRKDGKKWNEIIKLGNYITVNTKELGEKDLRLVGYNVVPPSHEKGTSPKLSIVLSDKTFIWGDVKFNSSYKKAQTSSNAIFNGKTKWNDYKEGVDTANSLRLKGLELSTAQVTGRQNNNAVTLDGYGLMFENTITKLDQLYLGSNLIAFSDDGWKTSKTALDKFGIRASTISGELIIGESLVIQNVNTLFKIDKDGIFAKGDNFIIKDNEGKTLSINSKFQATSDSISNIVKDSKDYTDSEIIIVNGKIDGKIGSDGVRIFVEQTPTSVTTTNKTIIGAINELNSNKVSTSNFVANNNFGLATGGNINYSLTLSPPPTTYINGMSITVIPNIDSGLNPTIDINGLGAIPIINRDGTQLIVGAFKTGLPCYMLYYNNKFYFN